MPTGTDNIKDRSRGDEMTQDERWENEHIAINGHLHVPVMRWIDPAPRREGWEPFFVTVNLSRTPPKQYIYRRVS